MGAGVLLSKAVSLLAWLQLLFLCEGPLSVTLQVTNCTRALHTMRPCATPWSPALRLVAPWSSDKVQHQNLIDVLENYCLMKMPSRWWGTVPSDPTFFPKGWNKRLCRVRRLREDTASQGLSLPRTQRRCRIPTCQVIGLSARLGRGLEGTSPSS